MAGTVLDALTVTLGLNAEGFTKGVATAGESVAGLAKKFTGMFFAIEGFEDVINYARNLSGELAKLSYTAQNLGLGVAHGGEELSRWGELAELAGGQAQDAAASFGSLRQAIFGQQMFGQMSPQLTMLARMRVPYLNRNGTMRDPAAIAMQLSQNLMREYPNDESQRYLIAQAAGFTGGVATDIGIGPAQLAKDAAQAAADQASLTEVRIDSQRMVQKSAVGRDYALESAAAVALATAAPAVTGLNNFLSQLLEHPVDTLKGAAAWTALQGLQYGAAGGVQGLVQGLGSALGQHLGTPRGIRNNNPLNLKDTKGNFRTFPTMAAGFAAAENQMDLYELRGNDTLGGIISKWTSGDPAATTANYIKSVSAAMGMSPGARITGAMLPALMSAMAKFEDNWAFSPAQVQRMLAPVNVPAAARGTISRGAGAAGAAGGKTVIINGGININAPQAKDAAGIAGSIAKALQRKLLVGSAEVGLA